MTFSKIVTNLENPKIDFVIDGKKSLSLKSRKKYPLDQKLFQINKHPLKNPFRCKIPWFQISRGILHFEKFSIKGILGSNGFYKSRDFTIKVMLRSKGFYNSRNFRTKGFNSPRDFTIQGILRFYVTTKGFYDPRDFMIQGILQFK